MCQMTPFGTVALGFEWYHPCSSSTIEDFPSPSNFIHTYCSLILQPLPSSLFCRLYTSSMVPPPLPLSAAPFSSPSVLGLVSLFSWATPAYNLLALNFIGGGIGCGWPSDFFLLWSLSGGFLATFYFPRPPSKSLPHNILAKSQLPLVLPGFSIVACVVLVSPLRVCEVDLTKATIFFRSFLILSCVFLFTAPWASWDWPMCTLVQLMAICGLTGSGIFFGVIATCMLAICRLGA